MTAARCYKVQPVIFGIVSIVTILLSYWCVPQYGLTGAGITLIFASIVQLIGSSLVIVYLLKKDDFCLGGLSMKKITRILHVLRPWTEAVQKHLL